MIWIIIPVILNSITSANKNKLDKRRDFVRLAAEGKEKEIILGNISDLPAWVSNITRNVDFFVKYKLNLKKSLPSLNCLTKI